MHYCGVDIGGTNVRVVIANEERLLIKISSETIKHGPPEALATQIIHLIQKALDTIGVSKDQLKGIGTSSAGPFVGGESLKTPNICGNENDWTVIPYLQVFREYFGTECRYELANDCVSSVKAEHLFGAGRGLNNCVYITISTGVGGGIISDGVLLEGKGKNAGHIGHTIVKVGGDLCGCGQRGCIETIISGKSIARRAMEAELVFEGKKDGYTSKEVFQLYRANDPIAKKIIEETIEYIAILFINTINMTDTQMLIVGGSVFTNNTDVLIPLIQDYITENSMEVLSEGVQIKTPELGPYVGDLAGLSLVLSKQCIEKWQNAQPWKIGIQKELFMTTDEAMNYQPK
jgi:glucokinase